MSKQSEQKEKLFEEFPTVSKEDWTQQVIKDLKGREFEKLKWKTYEDISISPFYTQEDLTIIESQLSSLPGEFPFIRGSSKISNDWKINQEISSTNINTANKLAITSIAGGADCVTFNCSTDSKGYTGIPIQDKDDMLNLLVGINIKNIETHFKCGDSAIWILGLFINEAHKRGATLEKLSGSVDFDPLKDFMLHGSFPNGEENSYSELKELISYLGDKMPEFKALKIHSSQYHDSGSSITQELAFTLAAGVEYLDHLTDMGLSVDQICNKMSFSFSIGSNYFMEIAKLRAARVLWAQIIEQYSTNSDYSKLMSIEVTNSTWNKTIYDPYVNMLRGTVETMAGALGGAGMITVRPLDSEFKESDDFSMRMARNTQLLLKNESYLERIADPSGGSYYIENLTNAIAGEAWKLFQEIENQGGIVESLKSGFIQKSIEETRQLRDINIATRKDSFLGVNQYPNLEETLSSKTLRNKQPAEIKSSGNKISPENKLSVHFATDYLSGDDVYAGDLFIEKSDGAELYITPLKPYRGAQAFEELRLDTERYVEKTKQRPKVFLLTIGNPSMRSARASFSANFFGCAGFEIINNIGFDSPKEGVSAAIEKNSDIIAICSSDDEYPVYTPEIIKELKENNAKSNVIVAGNPREHIEELKNAGVDDFIHIRSNALEILRKYQQILGITA